jgi:hypothetical protein
MKHKDFPDPKSPIRISPYYVHSLHHLMQKQLHLFLSDRQRQYVERQFWNYAPGIDNDVASLGLMLFIILLKFLKIVYVDV